jgi:hypothetical protein
MRPIALSRRSSSKRSSTRRRRVPSSPRNFSRVRGSYAGIAQRDETDLEPTLDHRRAVDFGLVADVSRQFGVVQRETRDGNVVSLDANVAAEIVGFYLPEHHFPSLRYPATDLLT